MKKMLSALCFGLLLCASASARDVGGYAVPDGFVLGGRNLVLNGAGVREKFFMAKDIYVAGLYLEAPCSDARTIIHADATMALRIEIVSGLVTEKNFTEHTLEGFRRSTGGNTKPIQEQIKGFLSAFSGKIHHGDVFDICYIKGKGIAVYKNGGASPKIEIPGFAIKPALFGIWLGEQSDERLRHLAKQLLNTP